MLEPGNNSELPAIPGKRYFTIGEVSELCGVKPHVLRYWETEFPMLAPQKNRAGQRTYRRRDVEMALRIKELLYDEQYTIAGAKKKLAGELRVLPESAGAVAGAIVQRHQAAHRLFVGMDVRRALAPCERRRRVAPSGSALSEGPRGSRGAASEPSPFTA